MRKKTLELTVTATVPKGMTTAHFRRLIKDQIQGGGGIYLSIHDQLVANTNAGMIKPKVSGARVSRP